MTAISPRAGGPGAFGRFGAAVASGGPAATALLLGVVAAAHAGALRAGFVWDDAPLVVQNRLLGDIGALPTLLRGDLWAGAPVEDGASGYYRPLLLLDYSVDVILFGHSAPWMHLRGLLWHLLAVLGVWRLSRAVLPPWTALAATLIFGLHPVQAEAVTWIAARNDPMAAALGGWALVSAAAGRGTPAAALALAAALSKESALLLPLLHLAHRLAAGAPARAAAPGALALCAGLAPALLLRAAVGVDGAGLPAPEGWALLASRAPALGALGAGLLLAPVPGSAGWALEYLDRLPPWRLLTGALGAAGLGLLLLRARPGLRWGALLWLAAALAPPLLAVADKGLFGERYLYLALVAVGWLAAAALPASGRSGPVACALVVVLGAAGLHGRAGAWVDDGALWAASRAAAPSPYTAASAGHARFLAGDLDGARADFVAAIDDPVPWVDACAPLLASAIDQGRAPLGVQLAAWGALKGCDTPRFRGSQALLLAALGRWEEAGKAAARAGADPSGRAEVVRAALALRAGDAAAFASLEAGFTGSPPLRAQAEQLLAAAAARP